MGFPFLNGAHKQLLPEEGYEWEMNEREGVVTVSAWTPSKVQAIAHTAGRSISEENLFLYTPTPSNTSTYTGAPVKLPTPPWTVALGPK